MPSIYDWFAADEFRILAELLEVLDGHLDRLDRAVQACPDPDAWDLSDPIDAACGLGFAAIQQYLASTAAFRAVDKAKALKCGPTLASGQTVAESVNHAANWWKHCDEWQLAKENSREIKTTRGIEALGVPNDERDVLGAALRVLAHPANARFASVLPLIKSWRDDLYSRYPEPPLVRGGP
jgi:hypothetical protein